MAAADQRQAWIDEAAAMRVALAAPGVADREALRTRSGAQFSDGISKGAPPIGELTGMTPVAMRPAAPCSKASRARALQPERRGAWRLRGDLARYRAR